VVAAVATVLTGVSAALPEEPPMTEVVSSATRLEGGAVLTAPDLTTVRLPPEAVPDGAVTDEGEALGRRVTAPVARGRVLTELDLVSTAGSVRAGRVVAPLRLTDGDLAGLLSVGDPVDVVAADPEAPAARIVARNVRVVGLPPPPGETGIGGSGGAVGGALVLVDVDPATATALAQAAVTSTLSVVLR
jgi:pilus assembly protein CpaB